MVVERTYNGKKDTVLKRLIFSYMGIFFIFLIFWTSVYGFMQYKIEKQTYSMNEATLNVLKNEIDKRIIAVNTTGVSLVWDNTVHDKLNKLAYATPSESAYLTYKVKKQLETYRKANSYLLDIYIYIKEIDFIISSHTAVSSEKFYEMNKEVLQSSYQEWKEQISRQYNSEYWAYNTENGKEEICLSYSLPFNKSSRSEITNATVVLLLTEGIFSKTVKELCDLSTVSFGIENNNMLLTYTLLNDDLPLYKTLTMDSEVNNFHYNINIPKNIYRKQQNFLFVIFIIILVVYMMIFIWITVYSIKRNYNPLRDLVTDIKKAVSGNDIQGVGEFVYLRNAFEDVMEQQSAYESLINQQMERLKESYLIQLLTGTLKATDVYNKGQAQLLKEFLYPEYSLILIKSDTYTDDILDIDGIGIHSKQEQKLLQGLGVKIGQVYVLLINAEGLTKNVLMENAKIIREKVTDLSGGYNMVVSSIHDINKGIHKVYYEMAYILQCMDTFGKRNSLTFEENFERREFSWYSKEDEVKLMNAVQSLDINKTEKILKTMWKSATGEGGITIDEAKVLLIGQINILYKAINEICPSLYQKGFPIKYHEITLLKDMQEIWSMLMEAVENIILQIEEQTSDLEAKSIVNMVVDYIDQNYMDVNLNVEKLCHEVGRSVSNISKSFRELRGESVLYYLNFRRIQEAKRKIKDSKGEVLMNELYSMIGFGSVNTFIRAFKKYEGITPGSYVEICQSSKF